MLNKAEEDYLKTIYELTVQNELVLAKTNDISTHFGYSDQSVNEMIKKLESKKLVYFLPYKGVKLTSKGKREAIRMIRVHRIWEVFLTDKLGIAWEDVHDDAEKLEHATSEQVLDKLYKYLGEPNFCQHGNPIPDSKGQINAVSHLSLSECEENDLFRITRVLDFKELLVYLNQEGISLHDKIKVYEKDISKNILKIKNKEKIIAISFKRAKRIFGEKTNNILIK